MKQKPNLYIKKEDAVYLKKEFKKMDDQVEEYKHPGRKARRRQLQKWFLIISTFILLVAGIFLYLENQRLNRAIDQIYETTIQDNN